MGWLLLVTGVLVNIGSIILVKGTQGTAHSYLAYVGYAGYLIGFVIASLSFKYIDVALAYAVWSGIGSLIVLLVGVFLFKESISVLQLSFFMAILVGVVGISVSA